MPKGIGYGPKSKKAAKGGGKPFPFAKKGAKGKPEMMEGGACGGRAHKMRPGRVNAPRKGRR